MHLDGELERGVEEELGRGGRGLTSVALEDGLGVDGVGVVGLGSGLGGGEGREGEGEEGEHGAGNGGGVDDDGELIVVKRYL
jgi:hypothetical protein